MKKLLSPELLILHMEQRGIGFNLVSKDEALEFLKNNNYYKKLSSYKKNYLYAPDKEGRRKYQNLEFAYLQELSKIDVRLRYLIIQMCLDIEHAVKVWIINECIKREDNGYTMSLAFLERYPDIKNHIHDHADSPYCKELISCHQHRYPIWILLEVISFGDLCRFYKYINDLDRKKRDSDIIFKVRSLRNAAAHSHCLIRDLHKSDAIAEPCVTQFISSISEITPSARGTKLSNHFICDFVSTLYFYNFIIKSKASKQRIYEEITDLFNNRMLRNKSYFVNNNLIKTSYSFTQKIVDKIVKSE